MDVDPAQFLNIDLFLKFNGKSSNPHTQNVRQKTHISEKPIFQSKYDTWILKRIKKFTAFTKP